MGKAWPSIFFAALGGVVSLCRCASLPNESTDGTTSVPVLTGTFIPAVGSNGNSGGNTIAGGDDANAIPSHGNTLPNYPARDSKLAINNQAAWHTFLTTHWGNADFVTTSYNFAQILDALAINIEVSQGRQYTGLAESAYNRISAGLYAYDSSASYDTPAFMALGLAHLYNATALSATALPHRNQYLASAKAYFAPVVAAESFDTNNVSLGVWWSSQHDARRTAGNATAVLAAMQIYAANQDSNMLAFARRVYDAWYKAAVDPVAFTVADGVLVNGTIDPYKYTHNFGLMLGAAVTLHVATGDSRYLRHAQGMAKALITTSGMTTGSGANTILIEPLCTTPSCGLTFFYRGMAMRALAQLAAIDGTNTAVQNVLNGTAAGIVASRNATDGHYGVDWSQVGATTQDSASDLAVAFSLAYLAQSAPQQAAQTPSFTVGLASESVLSLNLPILNGGDGQNSWATVGNFSSTAQTLNVPLVAPFAGNYTVVARYSVPGSSSVGIKITVPGNTSPQTVTLNPTNAATTMANTAPLNAVMGVGLNTVTLAAASVPANALIDAITVWPSQSLSSGTCNPTSNLALIAPLAGARMCGTPTFSWSGATGTQSRSDVFVDYQGACTAQGSATSCTMAIGGLASGTHFWQVVEDGCRVSAAGTFEFSKTAPVPPVATLMVSGTATVIAWPNPSDAQKVDVTLNGVLMCGQTLGTSCTVDTALFGATGTNTVVLTATNACGQVQNTQKF